MELPSMIIDLAIMLLTAGAINILFKRIRLPIILGYIVAGFLISPYFPLFLNVESNESISTWSEIGVIFLLFCIGLEFDLHKLSRIGKSALISAVVIMGGLILVGYLLGMILGLNSTNSLFLGAMISISSTAIIQKTFEELDLTRQKFAGLVMGTLIVEDVFSVFLMIILPAVSVTKASVTTSDLILNLGMMICYLILWLLLGIYLLPTFLNRVVGLMTDELLVIVATGLCFGMALLGTRLGFSPELGAFLAGSLMAGTRHVERIEHVSKGVKDLFGAVFFLSVGMMVDPNAILERWYIIVPVVIVAILAKLIFAAVGMLLSGQNLVTSLKSGFSLAPIGEFSFIIASLGITLGVMEDYLYPVIVSASIVTILITPLLMNNAEKLSLFITCKLPPEVVRKLETFTSTQQTDADASTTWVQHMSRYLRSFVIYGAIMLVTVAASVRFLKPVLTGIIGEYASIAVCCLLIYTVIALFMRPLLDFHSNSFTALWLDARANHPPLIALTVVKSIFVCVMVVTPVIYFFHLHQLLIAVIALALIFLLGRSGFMASSYLNLETRFLSNFNERTMKAAGGTYGKDQWLDEDLSIISYLVPEDAEYAGRTLKDLSWGSTFRTLVVKIRRGNKHIILPEGHTVIHPGDKLYVIAETSALSNFSKLVGLSNVHKVRTLKAFMESGYPDVRNAVACCVVKIDGTESFAGRPIRSGGIRNKLHCIVLGIQRQNHTVIMPSPDMVVTSGDLLWVIGSNNDVGRLISS